MPALYSWDTMVSLVDERWSMKSSPFRPGPYTRAPVTVLGLALGSYNAFRALHVVELFLGQDERSVAGSTQLCHQKYITIHASTLGCGCGGWYCL